MCQHITKSISEYNRQRFEDEIMGKSNTRLIPKVNKPTAKQLRPIALTDVSNKLFMTIIGVKIDAHQLENHENLTHRLVSQQGV